MADLSPKHSRRGKDLANKLAILAQSAPDPIGKRMIRDAVDRLRKRYGFSDETKRELILQSIELGCRTYDDIALETFLHKSEVIDLVKAMELGGLVQLTPMKDGERGRPSVYISLKSPAPGNKITEKDK
jgi:hypothetical protein